MPHLLFAIIKSRPGRKTLHISSKTIMAAKFNLPFTQPSSIVAFLCTLIIVVFVSPIGQVGRLDALSTAVRLFHLFSFAAWLGVQIWVTFFAGK